MRATTVWASLAVWVCCLGLSPSQALSFPPLNGYGNNPIRPGAGSTFTPFKREIAALGFVDGIGQPGSTPNARNISNAIFASSLVELNREQISMLKTAHGQFVAHDLVKTYAASPPEVINVSVTACDSVWNPSCAGQVSQLQVQRNAIQPGTGTGTTPRAPLNGATHFLDASTVYGNVPERSPLIRSFVHGKLLADAVNGVPLNVKGHDMAGNDPRAQRLAGDQRAGENPGLLALQGLWVLEHNRLCDELHTAHASWSDERLFNEARKRVIALIQHITYTEYIPLLLGTTLPAYDGYDAQEDPAVSDMFAVAAYRYGHSAIKGIYPRIAADGTLHSAGPLLLRQSFFNPAFLEHSSIADVIRGLIYHKEARVDTSLVDDVRNWLMGVAGDLVSVDITRGRDFGLAKYTAARAALGLPTVTSWSDITARAGVQAALAAVHSSVHDVDLWVGGLAEDPVSPAQVGPTFAAIIRNQFLRTRRADYFWHENEYAVQDDGSRYISAELLQQIRATRYSDVIKRNLGAAGIPGAVFSVPRPGAALSPSPSGAASPAPAAAAASPSPMPGASPEPASTNTPSNASAEAAVRTVSLSDALSMSFPVPDETSTYIDFTMTLTGKGWVGFGWGDSMADADLIIVKPDGTALDCSSIGYSVPSADDQQDVQVQSVDTSGTGYSITVRRPLNTGDSSDHTIAKGEIQNMMFAWDTSSSTVASHGTNRVKGELDLFEPVSSSSSGFAVNDDNSAYIEAYGWHGISMFGTWGMLLPVGVYTVRFAKHNPIWLKLHAWIGLIIPTLTLPAVGGALVLVGKKEQVAHAQTGIALAVLMLCQVLMGSIIRHWMTSSRTPPLVQFRWFTRVHRLLGWISTSLGFAQCGLGVQLLQPHLIIWYTVWVGVLTGGFAIAAATYTVMNAGKTANAHMLDGGLKLHSARVAYTVSQVRARLREGAKWVIMGQYVYDVTEYMRSSHPGGAYLLERVIGQDISAYFFGVEAPDSFTGPHEHSRKAFEVLKPLCIGVLAAEEASANVSWVDSAHSDGMDDWLLVSKRKVTGGRDPIVRMVFTNSLSNRVKPKDWLLSGMGKHMQVTLPWSALSDSERMRGNWRSTRDKKNDLPTRPYSIVRETDSDKLVMYVKRYCTGRLSPLLADLEPGAKVKMSGPHGLGMLEDDADGVVFAIALGTCVAPFFDLVTYLVHRGEERVQRERDRRNRLAQIAALAKQRTGITFTMTDDSIHTAEEPVMSVDGVHAYPPLVKGRGDTSQRESMHELQRALSYADGYLPPSGSVDSPPAELISQPPVAALPGAVEAVSPVQTGDQLGEHDATDMQPESMLGPAQPSQVANPSGHRGSATHSSDSAAIHSHSRAAKIDDLVDAVVRLNVAPEERRVWRRVNTRHAEQVEEAVAKLTQQPTTISLARRGRGATSQPGPELAHPVVESDGAQTLLELLDVETQAQRMEDRADRVRLKRRLRLVLLIVGRDEQSLVEQDWLHEMEARCPEIEIHVNLRRVDGELNRPRYYTGPVTPERLAGVIPDKPPHSFVVCGSSVFRAQMKQMLGSIGVPASMVTIL